MTNSAISSGWHSLAQRLRTALAWPHRAAWSSYSSARLVTASRIGLGDRPCLAGSFILPREICVAWNVVTCLSERPLPSFIGGPPLAEGWQARQEEMRTHRPLFAPFSNSGQARGL